MQIEELRKAKDNLFVYGAPTVGKTFLFENLDLVDLIDCTQIGTLTTTVDGVDAALDYLEKRYIRFIDLASKLGSDDHLLLVLDNLNALCPSIDDNNAPSSMVDTVKSIRVT